MSQDGLLGVAVIGLGVGRQHALAYANEPRCVLRCLCDHDVNKAKALAKELNVESVTADFYEVLARSDVQLVSIASYDADHAGQVTAGLRAGKHVFVEKPLCRTRQELVDIHHEWRKTPGSLGLFSNLVLREAALFKWLRQLVQTEALGDIYAIEGEYLYGRMEKIVAGWRGQEPNYSIMLGGGIHLVDLFLWITGQRPTRVYAAGNGICTSSLGFKYLDYETATLEYPGGMTGRISANFGCVHRHQHVLKIYGTKASFIFDDAGARLHASRSPDQHPTQFSLGARETNKGALIPGFVSALLSSPASLDTQMIFDGICICMACDESARLRTTMEVEYI